MIADRAQRVLAACEDIRARKTLQHQLRDVQTRIEEVRQAREAARQANAVVQMLRADAESEHIHRADELARRHSGVREFARALAADPDLITSDDDQTTHQGVLQIRAVCGGIHEAAKAAWSEYRTQQTPGDHSDILRAFEKTRPAVVTRLKGLHQRIRDNRKPLPTEREIEIFKSDVRNFHRELAELLGDAPTEVRAALRAAASPDGADLTHFTPAVVQWIQDTGIMDSFRVRTQ